MFSSPRYTRVSTYFILPTLTSPIFIAFYTSLYDDVNLSFCTTTTLGCALHVSSGALWFYEIYQQRFIHSFVLLQWDKSCAVDWHSTMDVFRCSTWPDADQYSKMSYDCHGKSESDDAQLCHMVLSWMGRVIMNVADDENRWSEEQIRNSNSTYRFAANQHLGFPSSMTLLLIHLYWCTVQKLFISEWLYWRVGN